MSTSQSRSSSLLTGLIGVLFLLGIGFAVANRLGSPYRGGIVEPLFQYVLPAAIALVAYVRFTKRVVWWEGVLLVSWLGVSLVVTGFVGFLAAIGGPAVGYPGPQRELLLFIGQFLASAVGLGVPYAIAGALRHDYPLGAVVSVLSAPIILYLLRQTVDSVIYGV